MFAKRNFHLKHLPPNLRVKTRTPKNFICSPEALIYNKSLSAIGPAVRSDDDAGKSDIPAPVSTWKRRPENWSFRKSPCAELAGEAGEEAAATETGPNGREGRFLPPWRPTGNLGCRCGRSRRAARASSKGR